MCIKEGMCCVGVNAASFIESYTDYAHDEMKVMLSVGLKSILINHEVIAALKATIKLLLILLSYINNNVYADAPINAT